MGGQGLAVGLEISAQTARLGPPRMLEYFRHSEMSEATALPTLAWGANQPNGQKVPPGGFPAFTRAFYP